MQIHHLNKVTFRRPINPGTVILAQMPRKMREREAAKMTPQTVKVVKKKTVRKKKVDSAAK